MSLAEQTDIRVLVAMASKHGATLEIAEHVAASLERSVPHGAASVRDVAGLTNIDRYDAVVLGSAVYMGRWLHRAREFVDRFETELAARPVWLFSTGPVGDPPLPAGELPDMYQAAERVGAVDSRIFAGRLDRSGLSFAERIVVRGVQAPDGDFRPWSDIDTWTAEIAAELRRRTAGTPTA